MKKILLTIAGALALATNFGIFGAAHSPEEQKYIDLLGKYAVEHRGFSNAPISLPGRTLIFENESNSPLEILFSNAGNIQQITLAPASTHAISPTDFHPLIGIRMFSMTTGSSWIPSVISTALSSAVYGAEYPYDVRDVIDKSLYQGINIHIPFKRSGVYVYPQAIEEATSNYTEAIKEGVKKIKAVRNQHNLYLVNNSSFFIKATYLTGGYSGGYTKPYETHKIIGPNKEIKLDDMYIGLSGNPIKFETTSAFGEASFAPAIAGTIYSSIDKDLAFLPVKSILRPEEIPFWQAVQTREDGLRYNITVGDTYTGWEIYVEPVDLRALSTRSTPSRS